MKASCRAKLWCLWEEETDLHAGSSDFLDVRDDLLDPVIPFQCNQYLLSHDLFAKRVHCALLNSAVTIVRLLDCPFGLRTNTGDKAVCRIILGIETIPCRKFMIRCPIPGRITIRSTSPPSTWRRSVFLKLPV